MNPPEVTTLIILFGVGFVTWFIALVRTLAIIKRQVFLLSTMIFIEEMLMLITGIWLARHGTFWSAVSCALGGVLASLIVMRCKHKD